MIGTRIVQAMMVASAASIVWYAVTTYLQDRKR